ncbi:MAG: 2-C-methyl-D-erythritol 4-phosphate cytidylyltransferase [Firmicutes bacterium]|jgi:2-C-methyl-D-erythritol 4-phosphate cytidylyltransferase|nr:2-C-methyl-D-erythritol 4-phosphate cytidylyltransferase [Bacillota bacterium]
MNVAMILAGGVGKRMGTGEVPKQYIDIYGKPIIVHTLEVFDLHEEIDGIVVVLSQQWQTEMKTWLRQYDLNKVICLAEAGETRQASIYNGLCALDGRASEDDIVLIHDAVRPLLSRRIISENIEAAKAYGAVDTVIPSADTIIKSTDGSMLHSVPLRKELYLGQTPQSFKYGLIKAVHEKARADKIADASDDCQLVIRYGHQVKLVQGDKLNFKITIAEDLLLLKALLKLGKREEVS